jgi:hypothetical protein
MLRSAPARGAKGAAPPALAPATGGLRASALPGPFANLAIHPPAPAAARGLVAQCAGRQPDAEDRRRRQAAGQVEHAADFAGNMAGYMPQRGRHAGADFIGGLAGVRRAPLPGGGGPAANLGFRLAMAAVQGGARGFAQARPAHQPPQAAPQPNRAAAFARQAWQAGQAANNARQIQAHAEARERVRRILQRLPPR